MLHERNLVRFLRFLQLLLRSVMLHDLSPTIQGASWRRKAWDGGHFGELC